MTQKTFGQNIHRVHRVCTSNFQMSKSAVQLQFLNTRAFLVLKIWQLHNTELLEKMTRRDINSRPTWKPTKHPPAILGSCTINSTCTVPASQSSSVWLCSLVTLYLAHAMRSECMSPESHCRMRRRVALDCTSNVSLHNSNTH